MKDYNRASVVLSEIIEEFPNTTELPGRALAARRDVLRAARLPRGAARLPRARRSRREARYETYFGKALARLVDVSLRLNDPPETLAPIFAKFNQVPPAQVDAALLYAKGKGYYRQGSWNDATAAFSQVGSHDRIRPPGALLPGPRGDEAGARQRGLRQGHQDAVARRLHARDRGVSQRGRPAARIRPSTGTSSTWPGWRLAASSTRWSSTSRPPRRTRRSGATAPSSTRCSTSSRGCTSAWATSTAPSARSRCSPSPTRTASTSATARSCGPTCSCGRAPSTAPCSSTRASARSTSRCARRSRRSSTRRRTSASTTSGSRSSSSICSIRTTQLPAIAVRWAREAEDGPLAFATIDDVNECKTLLRQSGQLIDKLTALMFAPTRVRAFPELAAGEQTALGLINRLSRARLTLAHALDEEEPADLSGEIGSVRAAAARADGGHRGPAGRPGRLRQARSAGRGAVERALAAAHAREPARSTRCRRRSTGCAGC